MGSASLILGLSSRWREQPTALAIDDYEEFERVERGRAVVPGCPSPFSLGYMKRSRQVLLVGLAVALGSVVIACAMFFDVGGRARARIRERYQQMTTALSAGDTNAVLALIAPSYRSSFDSLRFSRLSGFAKPLGLDSSVLVLGSQATVWPVRVGGNTVEMVKTGGTWYFTGVAHLD